jgi:hypothetical protein
MESGELCFGIEAKKMMEMALLRDNSDVELVGQTPHWPLASVSLPPLYYQSVEWPVFRGDLSLSFVPTIR